MNRRFMLMSVPLLARGAGAKVAPMNMGSGVAAGSVGGFTSCLRYQSQQPAASSPAPRPNARTSQSIFSAPQCEWNQIHDTDPEQGYVLRAVYQDSTVHLTFMPQIQTRASVRAAEATRPDGSVAPVPSTVLCDKTKKVQLILPTPFICRLLAVLDGSVPSIDVATRTTQGSFSGNYSTYNFELMCNSTLPDGTSMPWSAKFKPGEAVMLQRFLVLALEKNFGFSALKETALNNPRRASAIRPGGKQ